MSKDLNQPRWQRAVTVLTVICLHAAQAVVAQPLPQTHSDRPIIVAVDSVSVPPSIPPPPDRSPNSFSDDVPEKILTPPVNRPRDLIFKECAYCEKERLEWYYDFDEFKKALALCGADYIRLRFDREYAGDHFRNRATYYFSLKNEILLFDSLTIDLTAGEVHAKTTIKDNFFLNTAEDINGNLIAQINTAGLNGSGILSNRLFGQISQQSEEQSQLMRAANVSKTIHDSFVSKMRLNRDSRGLRSILSFTIMDRRFILESAISDSVETIQLNQSRNAEAYVLESRIRGAYSIGYLDDMPVSKNKQKATMRPPVITEYWISKQRLGGYAVLHIEVTSEAGLKKLVMPVDGRWKTTVLAGEKELTHSEYITVVPQTCTVLASYVEDINGKIVGSMPRWVVDDSYGRTTKEPFSKYWRDCPNCK
jgi:hypothetical protein